MTRLALAALLATATAATARAEPRVDWARGLVIAEGVGVADRHAPSPAVARGTSRRGAEDAAKAALATAIAALPTAQGALAGAAATPALASVVTLDAEPETDGAWRVTMAVPIEAVRQALAGGPRHAAAAGDAGAPVIVVDGVRAKPAVGWQVGGHAAATVWLAAVPAWAAHAPRVHATSAQGGAIAVALPPTASDATLYVLVPP